MDPESGMKPGTRRACLALIALSVACVTPAGAWWPEGHAIISGAALRSLPPEVPAFFRSGGVLVGHCSYDPDVAKNRGTPAVRNAEEPEHYIDMELLQGRALPATRYDFLKLCAELKLDPQKVGLAPYAVTEWTERLSVAFAEHRKWPENPQIRQKCLVYAGFLAHYAGDLCMPLHLTIHFDGRAREDGSTPRTGIHERVDSLIERLNPRIEDLARGQRVEPALPVFPAVLREIESGRALIDAVYQLEDKLPPRGDGPRTLTPEAAAFATERARAGTRFLASLYLAAWRSSAEVRLPSWLNREPEARKPAAKPTPRSRTLTRRKQ